MTTITNKTAQSHKLGGLGYCLGVELMEIDKMIKIGDKVKVTGFGGIYTTYKEMADLMGSELYKKNLYPEIMEFEVIEKHKHHSMDEMVYLLKNDEGEFLFDDLGSTIEVIKKPRTKTGFVKCEYSHAWEIIKLYEDGAELFKTDSDELQIERINSIALRAQAGYPIYRKVEVEIDERQEFIDTYASLRHKFHGQRTYDDFSGFMFDSGKFKLVE